MNKLNALAAILTLSVCATLAHAAEADTGAAVADTADQMFDGVPPEHIEFLTAFKKEHEEFFQEWHKLRGMVKKALELSKEERYGTEASREYDQALAEVKQHAATFRKMYRDIRTPIDQKVTELKEEAFKLNQQGDAKNARADKKREETLNRLYAETDVYASQASALTAMNELSGLRGLYRLANKSERAGIGRHDKDAQAIIKKFPGILEARLALRNWQADIEALEAGKKETELSASDKRQIAKLRAQMQKATRELEKLIGSSTKQLERDRASLEKKVARAEKQLEAAKKRKRSVERYEGKLREEQKLLNAAKEKLEVYEKLADWKVSEEKSTKKGH